MRINTNIAALNAYRNLVSTDNRLSKSLERLSSGLRINRAADDAAGLAISEKMRGQIRGLNQGMRNAQDGISLIQTAEGALNETHSILQRMRELSVQAASDTLTSSDRVEIQKEVDQLTGELNRIATTTEFNTKKLLDGTTSALTSTSNLKTKVFIRDGLRTIDQFGQKAVGGGNYKLEISATAGRGQVQKTDIMKVKHAESNWVNVAGTEGNLQGVLLLNEDRVTSARISFANTGANGSGAAAAAAWNGGDVQITVTLAADGLGGTGTGGAITVDDIIGAVNTMTPVQNGSGQNVATANYLQLNAVTGNYAVDAAGAAAAGATNLTTAVLHGYSLAVGDVADKQTQLSNIDRFWDSSGNFLVEKPQTITLVQGDGSKASFTIFGSDTIADIEAKLNSAIHSGLGQSAVNSSSAAYAGYVSNPETSGFFSVAGTFVIQSAVTGKDGEIAFIGDEGVINALSLTTIQRATDNNFSVNVNNAHTGDAVAGNVNITGSFLVGAVHPNVDVKFDSMAGVSVGVSDGAFTWTGGAADSISIHLSDNTMVFQIGANPLQDVAAAIGDMRAEALGVDNILVTNRDLANRAISQVDGAISRVSSERAKLGALQNRLDHTIANLGVAAENLVAAESRIRDLDFALEMVEFTRNQIMMQAGTSMLAQANMKPQAVLMLLG